MAIYEVIGVPEDADLRANVMRSKLFGVLQNMGTETRGIGNECSAVSMFVDLFVSD